MCCLICHGAVHVNRNLRNFTFTQQFLEVVQQNLGTTNCEGRDNNIATAFCSFINNTRQLALFVINLVSPVAVGRFCNHKIRAGQISRVFDNGLVRLSNITSEDELGLLTIFFHTHFYDSRAQNMTCHLKFNGNTRDNSKCFVEVVNFKHGQGFVGIVQSKERLYQFFTGTHTLAVSKFCVAFLNVSTVRQKNRAKFLGRFSAVNFTFKAMLHQLRQKAAVIHVGVGKHNSFNIRRVKEKLLLIKRLNQLGALEHTTINKNFSIVSFY